MAGMLQKIPYRVKSKNLKKMKTMQPATNRHNQSNFHFLFEPISAPNSGRDRRDGLATDPLEIPNGVAVILAASRGLPKLVTADRFDPNQMFIVQPLWRQSRAELLTLSPTGRSPWVNGVPAPLLALLSMRDEVLFSRFSPVIAHLTVFVRPQIGPPALNVVGKRCPVCKTKFDRDGVVYRCHGCGQLMHCGGTGNRDHEGLDCASVCGKCPTCESPVQLKSGYAYLPEFLRKARR